MPALRMRSRISNNSLLVRATGFSNAINFAPHAMPSLIMSRRTCGGVQKQKTSGFADRANARASPLEGTLDRKSTRLNSSHLVISYAVFCLKKKKKNQSNKNDR